MHSLAHSSSGYFSLRDRPQENLCANRDHSSFWARGFLMQMGEQVIALLQYTWSVRRGRQTGDGSSRTRLLVTVCQFALCGRSSIILRTYTNVWGVIILERVILVHFFRLFICLICESSRPVTNRHPFWRPVTDRVYWTFMLPLYPLPLSWPKNMSEQLNLAENRPEVSNKV